MKLKQSTQISPVTTHSVTSNKGFTLVELLVSTLVAGVILSVSLGLINEQRRQFLGDRSRTEANQTIRTSMDLIGADIKRTGANLSSDPAILPGITLLNGSGTVGAADEFDRLILQRRPITDILPVCQDLSAGTTQTTIDVSAFTPTPADPALPPIDTCGFSNGNDSDVPDVPDSLEQFRSYRWSLDDPINTVIPVRDRNSGGNDQLPAAPTDCVQLGGADTECSWAYIHDPDPDDNPATNDGRGEFFLYMFEDSGNCDELAGRTCFRLHAYPNPTATVVANRGQWQFTYTHDVGGALGQQPRIFILDEREYSLAADPNIPDAEILQLTLNRQNPPIALVNQLSDFRVEARVGGVWENVFDPPIDGNWQDVEKLRVILEASNPATSDQIDIPENRRTLTSEFFPRNSKSSD